MGEGHSADSSANPKSKLPVSNKQLRSGRARAAGIVGGHAGTGGSGVGTRIQTKLGKIKISLVKPFSNAKSGKSGLQLAGSNKPVAGRTMTRQIWSTNSGTGGKTKQSMLGSSLEELHVAGLRYTVSTAPSAR
jgi:hypothetical protein